MSAPIRVTLENQGVWWAALVGLLALSAFCSTYGLDLYPLETHEIFVAQSAIEMGQRGGWVVPYFNGEPRLNKPPLNYWLTGLASWLDGTPVTAFHARLPSAIAGIGLVGLTLLVGRLLFGRATAVSAALILVCTAGFLQYTHNARPEMLYAFWCTAGLAAFVGSWKSTVTARAQWLAAHAMWLCFGLATLTKGPHFPAIFLAIFAGFLASERVGWRQAWRILQPISGLLLMLAITLPWWWLLKQHVGEETLKSSQLSGALLAPGLENVLDPYYLYRTAQLALPWLILFPVAAIITARWASADRRVLLLLGLILIPALLLSIGPQRRWYYMLPALAPMCLLLAVSLERLFAESNPEAALQRWLAWALPGQWVLAVGLLLGWAIWTREGYLRVGLVVALAALAALPLGLRRIARGSGAALLTVASSTALFLVAAGFVYTSGADVLLGDKRERMAVAQFLTSEVPMSVPLATLDTGSETYVYYTQRQVLDMESPSQIQDALAGSEAGQLILILRRSKLEGLPSTARREILFQSVSNHNDPLLVLRLGP